MNLATEYAVRNKIMDNLISFPCSIFMESIIGKLVATVEMEEDKFSVKYWHLSKCTNDQALPPMTQRNMIGIHSIVPKGWFVLEMGNPYFPSYLNTYKRPMRNITYNEYCEKFFSDTFSQELRMGWLWDAFEDIYDLECNDIDWITNLIYTKDNDKRSWKYWCMWRKHMMDNNPGDLLFSLL